MKYFGTDGIRGAVDGPLMEDAFLRRLGYAIGRFLLERFPDTPRQVVIGTDTRASGPRIVKALSEGLIREQCLVYQLGVVPTPAVSRAICDMPAHFGLAITASHNPASDNGVKLFNEQGQKLPEEEEARIENMLDAVTLPAEVPELPEAFAWHGEEHYIHSHCLRLDKGCLADWRVVLDTAHGATYRTSPALFEHLGAEVIQFGDQPDGNNINEGVGSEHPGQLAERVLVEKARLGLAHDGDGDRVILVDESGYVLDGDELMALVAREWLKRGRLKEQTLVSTQQSNRGLDLTVNAAGGRVLRSAVGDRNVLYRMLEAGSNVGGESSGHFIFLDYARTGDGLLAAIEVISLLLETGKSLRELREGIRLLPSATGTVRVHEKTPLAELPELQAVMKEAEESLADSGRILVRYSGTEPKLRLLVEASTEEEANAWLERLREGASAGLDVVA